MNLSWYQAVRSGRFRPALCGDLEQDTHDDLEGPVLPYPHLKATLTSWQVTSGRGGCLKR